MVSNNDGFSHIAVTPDDGDDVVIEAGSRPRAQERSAGDSDPRRGRPAEADPPQPAGGRDGYRETSLEDLKGAPMPLMQKAIIAVALIGVIAFAVYYGFLR